MRRQGVEDIKGKMPLVGQPPKQPRRKLSKTELREQAAAAFLAWRKGTDIKKSSGVAARLLRELAAEGKA
jgi:hypothetical protein